MLKKPRKYVLYRCVIGKRGTGPSAEAAQQKANGRHLSFLRKIFRKYLFQTGERITELQK